MQIGNRQRQMTPTSAPAFQGPPAPEAIASPTRLDQLDAVELNTNAIQFRGLAKNVAFQGGEQGVWERTDSNLFFEQGKPDARLAVMDQFGMTLTPSGFEPGHGEFTLPLAQRASGLDEADILRVDNSHQDGDDYMPHPADPQFEEKVDRYITGSYAGFAEITAENLEAIHESHPSVTTVSHSQGIGATFLSNSLYQRARQEPEFGTRLGEQLGLEAGAFGTAQGPHNPEAAAALGEYVQERLSTSPEVAQGVDRLEQTLTNLDGKVRYFNSAGNEGEFQALAAEGGFVFEPRFQGTVQNEVALTESIGSAYPAFQPSGQAEARPDVFTNRAPVDAAALGTALFTYDPDGAGPVPATETVRQGTSYSAPLAAGAYVADPRAYENLSLNAIPAAAGVDYLGAGMLDISY